MFRTKLIRCPANDGPILLRNRSGLPARHLFEYGNLTVATDEMSWNTQVQQKAIVSRGIGPGSTSPPDHNLIDSSLADLLKRGFQCGKIPVNVIDCSNSHDRPAL